MPEPLETATTTVSPAAPSANPTLKNNTLLFLIEWEPSPTFFSNLQAHFPDLKIVVHRLAGYNVGGPNDIGAEILKDVTVIVTYKVFPDVGLLPRLKFVQLSSAGCNHVIGGPIWEQRKDVKFCTANGIHPPQIAEWVFATYLSHQHHILTYYDAMRTNNWMTSTTDEDTEDCVSKTVGILGYGCIGRQCARIASSMGMSVYAFTHRPRLTPESRIEDSYIAKEGMGDPNGIIPEKWFHGTTSEDVNAFLESGIDLLVIAMPLTALTKGMISMPQFEIMAKRKTYISNVGRGPIVNTEDLMTALDKGYISGAALDVTDPEPLPKEHKLWEYREKGVIVTPHISGNSMQYNARTMGILELNLERLSKGEKFVNEVDRELGY